MPEEKVQIHVRVSKRTRQRLKLLADEDDTTIIAIAERFLDQALDDQSLYATNGFAASLRKRIDAIHRREPSLGERIQEKRASGSLKAMRERFGKARP